MHIYGRRNIKLTQNGDLAKEFLIHFSLSQSTSLSTESNQDYTGGEKNQFN